MHKSSSPDSTEDADRLAAQVPSIWMSRWETALATGDYAGAAECARRLEQLGVRVRLAWTGREVATEGASDAR
jgi:hypothetical protein